MIRAFRTLFVGSEARLEAPEHRTLISTRRLADVPALRASGGSSMAKHWRRRLREKGARGFAGWLLLKRIGTGAFRKADEILAATGR